MAPPGDPLLFRLLTEIGIIEQLTRNALERRLPEGLKMSQFVVLNHLVRLGGAWAPSRLASALQVTKGAMTNTLTRLEARGLVVVAGDPGDRRGKLVSLTDAGREMRARCVACITPLLARLMHDLDDNDAAIALPVLEKIRKHLDANRD